MSRLKLLGFPRPSLLVLSFVAFLSAMIMPHCALGAWFDNNWHYRVPVNVPAGAAVNSTVKVDVDFAALLTTLGVSGTFDVNSPRVVRPNDNLGATQEYTDAVYAGATDATGNSRGEIRFLLEDAGAATYYIYFDITANGTKSANSQNKINGNFEFDTTGTSNPRSWTGSSRSDSNMDTQVRPNETVSVTDTSSASTSSGTFTSTPSTVTTDGSPNTGNFSYLIGFRSKSDSAAAVGTNATLTRTIAIPATNPGNINIRIKPEGWDSAINGSASTFYDYLEVRLLNTSTSAVLLDIVGPSLSNYTACPFSPNYGTDGVLSLSPGFSRYNYWDNGINTFFGNNLIGMAGRYSRGAQVWTNCSASLSSVAGQTVKLEIKVKIQNLFRSWFLVDDVEWSVVSATLGTPISSSSFAIVPANFNCVETGANASTGHLYTKLSGTAFNFDVVALKSDGNVETSYAAISSKNVTVELVDGSGTTACASRTALSPTISQTLSFSSTNQGRKTSANMTVSKAYANLRCRVTDANQSPSVVGCSTDNFSVRPTGFTVSSTLNADATGASVSATPTNKAGTNFTLTAASGVVGYNSTPLIDSSKLSAHSGAIQAGTINGSFAAADPTNGTATGTAFAYSEAGYFRLAAYGVYDNSFANVDSTAGDCSNNFSNALVSGLYGCNFGNTSATNYFGRFIPDHFAITPGSALPACNSVFTYFGQDGFSTLFTLLAQNLGNIMTQNYHGGFAKLGATSWNGFNFSSASLPSGSALSASATAPTGTWNRGLADVVAKHQVSRPTVLAGETSIIVKAAPVDSDGVTMTASAVAPGTPLRYGRLNLQNAHGSELLPLPVSLTAQYWDGSTFVLNTDDSCTTVTAPTNGSGLTFYPEVTAGIQGNHLGVGETTASVSATGKLVSGDALFNFAAPGLGNDGFLDLTINAPTWLRFDWNNGTVGDEQPSGRVTFGIYEGNDSQIFMREVY